MIKISATALSGKRHRVAATVGAIALTIFIGAHTASAATILTFEDLPPKTNVTTQYGARGVVFPQGAFLDTASAPRSGTRVLRAGNPGKEFHPGPFRMEFTSGQRRVRLFAGTTSGFGVNGTLRAFNAAGSLIAQDGPKAVAATGFTAMFEVKAPAASIVRVELEMGTTEFEAIDDLEFEGVAPPPPAAAIPSVQVTSVANNAQLDVSTITVQGTVTGEALLPTARLKLEIPLPPGSMAPPFQTGLPLSGAGRTRTFSLPSLTIGIGPHVLTVEAENTAGKGSARVSFTNLPGPIRTRYASEGADRRFGNFRFGTVGPACKVAVYERGAISVVGTATRVILGQIFSKWLSVRDESGWARLGCPAAEARGITDGAGAQDFEKGRIYAGLPTGTHHVPMVFAQAIDRLGGEIATGLPISDPRKSIGVMQTWLFQQFRGGPGQTGFPFSTLEIRGTPPTLWVERQGGHLAQVSAPGLGLSQQTPTLWQRFECSGHEGPCNIVVPASAPPLVNAGGRFCGGTTYPWGPPEWSAVVGNHVLTPILGIVKSSVPAFEDNPLTHEYFRCCPCTAFPGDITTTQCPSDWRVYVLPLHPHRNLFADNKETVELEWEEYYSQYFFVGWNAEPRPGDLLFASGRWIIDCGHNPYNSELHPPSVVVPMRTATYRGRPATMAHIWVNGWYTGDPVDIDIFPPPRPSPDALLVVVKPVDADAAFGVNIQDSIVSSTHVRIRFTAPPRRVRVTDAGQMLWEPLRAYYGTWYVFWE
jgi:hypothetical protein